MWPPLRAGSSPHHFDSPPPLLGVQFEAAIEQGQPPPFTAPYISALRHKGSLRANASASATTATASVGVREVFDYGQSALPYIFNTWW